MLLSFLFCMQVGSSVVSEPEQVAAFFYLNPSPLYAMPEMRSVVSHRCSSTKAHVCVFRPSLCRNPSQLGTLTIWW